MTDEPKPPPIPPVGQVGPPRKRPNEDVRSREHLTPPEVARLAKAAGRFGRHGHRDSSIIMTMYIHG